MSMSEDNKTLALIDAIHQLVNRLDHLSGVFGQFQSVLPDTQVLDQAIAFRWEKTEGLLQTSGFIALPRPQLIGFETLG
ncbi:MAG: hypothetical protein EOO68_26455, partial [Moraxellaceae bacterium]